MEQESNVTAITFVAEPWANSQNCPLHLRGKCGCITFCKSNLFNTGRSESRIDLTRVSQCEHGIGGNKLQYVHIMNHVQHSIHGFEGEDL